MFSEILQDIKKMANKQPFVPGDPRYTIFLKNSTSLVFIPLRKGKGWFTSFPPFLTLQYHLLINKELCLALKQPQDISRCVCGVFWFFKTTQKLQKVRNLYGLSTAYLSWCSSSILPVTGDGKLIIISVCYYISIQYQIRLFNVFEIKPSFQSHRQLPSSNSVCLLLLKPSSM